MTTHNPKPLDALAGATEEFLQPLISCGADKQQLQFVSRMRLHPQDTPAATLEQEQAIVRAQPDVYDGDSVVYDDEGWDSRVFIVNDGEVCYKFPRSAEVMTSYGREILALNMLGGLGTGVRTQRFKDLNSRYGFFSYHGLVGTQLSELLDTIDVSEKQRIGSEIGSFLKVLHSSEFEAAPVITVDDEVEEYKAKYQLAVPVIESNFSSAEQTKIAEFFHDYMPDQMMSLGSETRLCHGDLGLYNIIIDSEGVPGIIDFGNLGYYEQSKDFIDFGDDDILEAVYKAYGDSPILRAKAAVRMAALPAIDLVYYMGKRDRHGVHATIERLRGSLPGLLCTVDGIS